VRQRLASAKSWVIDCTRQYETITCLAGYFPLPKSILAELQDERSCKQQKN
jgi:hypothetical protein